MIKEVFNKEEMEMNFRPFVNVWSQCTPEFIALIEKLFFLVRHG